MPKTNPLLRGKGGYLLISAIVSGLILSSLALVITNVVNRDVMLAKNLESSRDFDIVANEKASAFFEYSYNTNSWSSNDFFLCQSGSIMNLAGANAVCTGEYIPGSDWIDDVCNNDDYKPTFYTDFSIVERYLTPDSNKYDDDADSRIHHIGFIYPQESQTIFSINETIRNLILKNTNNTVYSRPFDSETASMEIQIQGAGLTGSWVLEIFSLDRNSFLEKKNIRILSKKSQTFSLINGNLQWILDFEWVINWPIPYSFNLGETDYAVNIQNTSDTIFTYKILLKSGNKPIYTVPVNDSINPMQYIATKYTPMSDQDMSYQEKIISQANPKNIQTTVNTLNPISTTTNDCSIATHAWSHAQYSIPNLIHGESKTVSNTGTTSNGAITYSIQASCWDGNLSYLNETIKVTCDSGYTESAGYTCSIVTGCSGTITDSNASSTSTGTTWGTWKYSSRPGICTWNCNYGYTYDSESKSCKLIPPGNVTTNTATNITYSWATWNWNPVATATYYEISTNGTTWNNVWNVQMWSEVGLTCETSYTRQIRACHPDYCGNPSTLSATTGVCWENGPCVNLPQRAAFYDGTPHYTLVVAPLWTTKDATIAGYQSSPTQNTCQWKCGTNYTWDGNTCIGATRSTTCSWSLPANTTATTATTHAQTWNDTTWVPTISWSYGSTTCWYGCAIGYVWNGSTCIYNQVNPTSLSLSHSSNLKSFTASWSAGIGNHTCKLQFNNGGTWGDIQSWLSVNCDTNTSATFTLNDDGWKNNWNGTQIRLVRTGDGVSVGTFPQTLVCSTTSGNTSSTPNYDENCNGNWNDSNTVSVNYECGYNSCSTYWTTCSGACYSVFAGTYHICGTCNWQWIPNLCVPSWYYYACWDGPTCDPSYYLPPGDMPYWTVNSCSPNYSTVCDPPYSCQQTSCNYISQTCSWPVTYYY
jgi:hypothetical protein